MFEKLIRKKLFDKLKHIEYGSLVLTTPENEQLTYQGDKPGRHADVQFEDWRVVANLINKGDVGFAEDYRDGFWSTSNLPELMIFGLENDQAMGTFLTTGFWYSQFSKLTYLARRNSRKGSKKNIVAHYDLGNDFYKLWLDASMTYSSAVFASPEQPLEAAQQNKYDHILSHFDAGGDILEIGCGWGGFMARALAHNKGWNLKGITLSQQQYDYARAQVGDQAEVAIEDYRDQQGQYDYIVSIEMIEAVGKRYWPTYFRQIKSLLKPGGKAVIQVITIADSLFDTYCRIADVIRTHIFPGGMLPCPAVLQEQLDKVGLKWADDFSFARDYARTLTTWHKNFLAREKELKRMGFDEGFQRMWEFYLASCIGTFTTGRTNVHQMVVTHA